MKKIACLLLMVYMIGLHGPANAGDSWVLWKKTEVRSSGRSGITPYVVDWEIQDGFAKESACKVAREVVWNRIKAEEESFLKYMNVIKVKDVPFASVTRLTEEQEITHTLYCLPGNLDPRK